ncbi:hypothetical protein [Polaromonas glacialis]|nr:hypothetical protein [Polaromonas glacialis]
MNELVNEDADETFIETDVLSLQYGQVTPNIRKMLAPDIQTLE